MSLIIRQEINIIDASYTGTGTVVSNETVALDTTQYINPTYYFEAVISGAASNTGTVKLTRQGTTTNDASVNGATSATVVRSRSSSFVPPVATTAYEVRLVGDGLRSQTVKAARIIIIDNPDGLARTETQIEIGNNETGLTATASAHSPLGSPKYWLYTAANWNGTLQFFAEVTYAMASSKSSGTIVLQEDNGSFASWADKVTIVNAGVATATAPATRVRSSSFTPTDGRHYRIAYLVASSKSAMSIYSAKIVVDQISSLANNIIGYYKFDENSGTTTADATSNRAAGTWNGTLGSEWATGKINSGGNFNGTDNYVVVQSGYLLGTKTNATWAGWIKTNQTPGGGGGAIYSERAASGNDIWKIEIAGSSNPNSQGALQFTHRDDANTLNQPGTGTFLVNDNNWHHVALVKSGTSITIYIDGISRGTGTLTGTDTLTDASPSCRFGTDIQDGTAWYKGLIDEVGMWLRALSAAEVALLYNNGVGIQYSFANASNFNLFEAQYLMLNTSSTTTGLQSFQTLWKSPIDTSSQEWGSVTLTIKHALEGSGAEVGELDDIDNSNTVVTNSNETITAGQQTITAALVMPTSGHQIDTNYKTKVTALWGSRMLVQVNASPLGKDIQDIQNTLGATVQQSVNRAGTY